MWDKGGVLAVAALSDGQWIAMGGEQKNITLWNATTCEKAIELEGHSNDVQSLEFSPDSVRVVSGLTDKTVIIWSTTTTTTTTGKCLLGPLKGHAKRIREAHFSLNGNKIASCDGHDIHDSIKCFSSSTGALLAEWKAHPDIITSITLSSNGKFMASTSHNRTVYLWDMTTLAHIGPTLQCGDEVYSVAISPAGSHLLSGGHDMKIHIWSLEGMVPRDGPATLGPLKGHTNSVWEAHFSPNGNKVTSCDGDDICIWNSHSGDLVIAVNAVFFAWTPDGQQLIAGCGDGSIKCIASSTGSLIADWKAHTNLVHSISVSPNCKFLACASPDKSVRLWAMMTSMQIGPPLQCPDRVYSVAISPDGTHLARGGRDSTVRIWRLEGMVSPSLFNDTP
ncbi:hypothetical protein PAXINDRAFT_86401 [Paxillus involutus ATCC 200175]|uniref:WD40 repeat-like protein n=1 Tax=Paxillus involutus ATCC 200175 TaxID=664439 RepID=A0A0C9TR30_PAXIN|nr:hypothetical protein PAXINDRAFT_86401 [Paxillus involutus ATCC 200175]